MTAPRGIVAVVSGPSGVGKTTVIEGLLRRPGYARSITATTRAPRGTEKDGVDYLFLAAPAGVVQGQPITLLVELR